MRRPSWRLAGAALIEGAVAALVGFVPFLLCALANGLLGLSIALAGLGSVGSAIVVETIQVVLFALAAVAVAAAARVVTLRSLDQTALPEAEPLARAGAPWATLGALVAMVVSGHLRLSATIPAINFSDSARMSYVLIGPACGSVGALLAMCLIDPRRRVA